MVPNAGLAPAFAVYDDRAERDHVAALLPTRHLRLVDDQAGAALQVVVPWPAAIDRRRHGGWRRRGRRRLRGRRRSGRLRRLCRWCFRRRLGESDHGTCRLDQAQDRQDRDRRPPA